MLNILMECLGQTRESKNRIQILTGTDRSRGEVECRSGLILARARAKLKPLATTAGFTAGKQPGRFLSFQAVRMPQPIFSRLRQFSLRGLFFAISGCSVALAIWAVPYEADVKDPHEFSFCSSGMSQKEIQDYSAELDAQRETCRVYRDLHGNRIKHGVAVLCDGNGVKLRERHWSHDKLDGIETTWDKHGEVEQQTRYREGKRHGWERRHSDLNYYEENKLIRTVSELPGGKCVEEYHADGSTTCTQWSHNAEKLSEVTYTQQLVRHGPTTTFHANGMISCEGAWRNNREDGTWSWWDDRGVPLRTIEFNDGRPLFEQAAAARVKFVVAQPYGSSAEATLSLFLFGESFLGSPNESISEAFAGLEDIHGDSGAESPAKGPHHIHVRGSYARARLDSAEVTDEAERLSLRAALQLLLAPLQLEAVVYDNAIWVVSTDEARAWVEATPVSRFVSEKAGRHLNYNDGLQLGRTTLQTLLNALNDQKIVMRLDEARVPDATALLAREIDADVPGCTVGAAIDIVLKQLGLAYYANNDEFIIVPIETP